jgi:hypothetical protein
VGVGWGYVGRGGSTRCEEDLGRRWSEQGGELNPRQLPGLTLGTWELVPRRSLGWWWVQSWRRQSARTRHRWCLQWGNGGGRVVGVVARCLLIRRYQTGLRNSVNRCSQTAYASPPPPTTHTRPQRKQIPPKQRTRGTQCPRTHDAAAIDGHRGESRGGVRHAGKALSAGSAGLPTHFHGPLQQGTHTRDCEALNLNVADCDVAPRGNVRHALGGTSGAVEGADGDARHHAKVTALRGATTRP